MFSFVAAFDLSSTLFGMRQWVDQRIVFGLTLSSALTSSNMGTLLILGLLSVLLTFAPEYIMRRAIHTIQSLTDVYPSGREAHQLECWWQRSTSAESDEADRLLRTALSLDERNAATAFASGVVAIATPETTSIESVAQHAIVGERSPESLPPEIAQRIESIDWRSIAELVESGVVGETAVLKGLGFPASSTSAKYRAVRAQLQAARQAKNEC